MDLRDLTREQKMLAAAAACGLFVISLFLPWYGAGGSSVDGADVIPAYWIFLLMALLAGGMYAAEAFEIELPEQLRPISQGALLTLFPAVLTIAWFIDPPGIGEAGREWGIFVGLIASVVAAILAVWLWRDER